MVNVFATGSVAKEVPMQVIFRGIVPFFLYGPLCTPARSVSTNCAVSPWITFLNKWVVQRQCDAK
jgi:hypothetical protein